jgi:hypothetical protein
MLGILKLFVIWVLIFEISSDTTKRIFYHA